MENIIKVQLTFLPTVVSENNYLIKLNFGVCFCKTLLTSENETRASAIFDNVLTYFFSSEF